MCSLFHAVVESDEISSRIIRYLTAEKGGRVTFMPLNLFQELVLDRITSVAAQNASGKRLKFSDMSSSQGPAQEMDTLFPQGVLTLLKGISDGNVASCVKRICTMLGKKGRLKAGIALALQNIITTSESVSLKYSVPIEKWTAPPGAWMLLSEVSAFTPKAVGWKFLCHHWQLLDQLLAKSEEILDEYISQFSNADKNDSFKTPRPTSKTRSRTKKKGKSKSSDILSLSIQVVTAIFKVGALVLVCPTTKLGRLVTLLQAMVTSKGSSAGSAKHGRMSLLPKQVAPAVYTQSWVTLGKICLADDKLAKFCIPVFV